MTCANPKCGKEFEPKDRRQKYCTRKCMHLYCRNKYNEKNIEKVRVLHLRWNKDHPDKCKEAQVRYYKNNRHVVLGRLKQKRLADPAKWNQKAYDWRAKNPEKTRQIDNNTRRKGAAKLADWYIRTLLTEKGKNKRKHINHPDLIKVKRIHIELFRELKQQKTWITKNCTTQSLTHSET